MTMDVSAAPTAQTSLRARRAPREVIYRHRLVVRLTHAGNAVAIVLLIGSGLNIFNAHPRLYWGQQGSNSDPAMLAIGAVSDGRGGLRGMTQIGALRLDTTGWLGAARSGGHWAARAWPDWITIPSFQDLADARHWHFLAAWLLAANGLLYLAWSLASRHLQRDLWPRASDLRAIPRSVWDHVRLRHPTGAAARRYNVLQRLAYLGVIALVLGMVLTGMTLSPGFDAWAPWLLDLFGGRQSARTLHFVFMGLIALFVAVHLTEVVLAGPINEVRSMITGRFALPREDR